MVPVHVLPDDDAMQIFASLLALQFTRRRRTSRMRDRLLIRLSGPILVKDKMHAKFMAATVLVVLLRVSATI